MTMTLECRTEFPRALEDIMRSLELNGDVVYKGYPYMRAGQEVWQVEAHLYKNKGMTQKLKDTTCSWLQNITQASLTLSRVLPGV